MRLSLLAMAFVAALATLTPALAFADDPIVTAEGVDVSVLDSAVCLELEERQPKVRETTFATGDKIYVWLELSNSGEETTVTLTFKLDGTQKWATDLKVGRGRTWRTWAKKRIRSNELGSWTVDVTDAEGKNLQTISFTAK